MKIFIVNLNKNLEVQSNSTVADVFEIISLPNKNNIIIAKNENSLLDWNYKISENEKIEFLDFNSDLAKEVYRHSASHIMAQAVKRLFPDAKIAIGPAIEDGFYYDFDVPKPFEEKDLTSITEEMKRIIKEDIPIVREEISKEEAIKIFKEKDEIYKLEILEEIGDKIVSIYRQGEFVDLCRGPHIRSTGKLKAFKLLSIAGAYWRGSEKNKMLQRIYGTAWDTDEKLNEYLEYLKEAEERDHRKLGTALQLFSIQEQAGPGLVFWHPNGAAIRMTIEDFWKKEHIKRNYQFVYTPHIAKIDLWKTSGHWENYRENIYSPMKIDEQEYIIKPMNCPGHILIFKSRIRSYRELPLRWAELGTVYRYERSGVLHGLLRVRGFTQDDAHIFCTEEQLQSEIEGVLELVFFMLKSFKLDKYKVMLSTRPEKYAGNEIIWEKATNSLKKALENKKVNYDIDEGAGVFYGPKIDIQLIDALNRPRQGPTIQVDFVLPERFNVTYIGEDGKEHRPVMIHRAVLGSFERFLGILIEHYKGSFPVWLAPIQVSLLTISDEQIPYANEIVKILKENFIRVETNFKSEKINNKIRDAIMNKIPYIFIIGKKEMENREISIRDKKGEIGKFKLVEAINFIKKQIEEKN
jgi:threonyl-tRNA synthetase